MGRKYHIFKYLLFLFLFISISLAGIKVTQAAVMLEDWQRYDNDASLSSRYEAYDVTYQTRISDAESQNNILYIMTTGQAVWVWLDERPIYTYGNINSTAFMGRGKRWHLVALPRFSGTAKLRIQYIGNDYMLPDGIEQVTLDQATKQTRRLFSYDAIEALSIPVAILLIFILSNYYFNQAAWKRLNLRVMVLTLVLSLWSFSITHVKQLWFDLPVIWWHFSWTMFYLQILLIGLVVNEVIAGRKKEKLQRCMKIYTVLVLAGIWLQLALLPGILYKPAAYISLFAVVLVPAIAGLIQQVRQGNVYARYTLLPVIAMVFLGLFDTIAHACKLLPKDIFFLPLSSYVFIAFAALMLREQMLREHRLEEQMASLEYEIAVAMEKAEIDPLTNCHNRRAFDRFINQIFRKNSRQKFALIMLDVDHFKSINDTYGHACGDKVLLHLSGLIREKLDKSQRLFRWGGEEFVIYYELAGKRDDPVKFADMLRKAIAAVVSVQEQPVTASFGIALWHGLADTKEDLFRRMDGALYLAKRNGRNRVECELDDV